MTVSLGSGFMSIGTPVSPGPSSPSFSKEKYFARLGEERTQQVEEAVDEVISYWQDRLRVRRRVARSQYDCQNICQKGSAGQAVQGPRGVVRQGVS